ncbi:LysR family transcriptional regulator [Martelella mediterranea]|uniref:DNA-binding transcriptional LysR family regulator n=1 Tax=Martelella mediterranea TaxID=293089 RepID=A0A4R3P234_9HYPH|nr:LysR family transcriptional regulator [Martelella mediterranea]TCT44608.1 DNA-binding transcriptional LysR family regulator [Martelella mediterranea]
MNDLNKGNERVGQDEFIRRGLRFSQLRLISLLDRKGQISSAAAQLGMTQSAASRLLSELEYTVGAKLYERHGRGVVLTEAGQALARQALIVLNQLDGAHDELAQIVEGARGLVRVGAVTGPSLDLVMPVIRQLRAGYPGIEISVLVDTSDKLAEALFSYNLDFYIGRLPEEMDAKSVTMRPIGVEPITMVARLDHPLGQHHTISIGDCLDYDWILQPVGSPMRRSIESHLLANRFTLPEHVFVTASPLLALSIISETDAVTPMAKPVADFLYKGGSLGANICKLPVREHIDVSPYSIIQRASVVQTPPVKRVLALIEEELERQGEERDSSETS